MAVVQNNVDEWIKENQKYFLPPVCNKMMHDGQLKVFYVGGPNVRQDFHLEIGEEFFYMRNGDMDLLVMEKGKQKTVHIRQGEVFLLPGRIPHSPQRYINTVGLVTERLRTEEEKDCLRYYTTDSSQILFERWFQCIDLGTQLKPVIEEFFASEEFKTGNPSANSRLVTPPYEPDEERELDEPFSLNDWLERNSKILDHMGKLSVFGSRYESEIIVYGPGEDEILHKDADALLWQIRGSSTVDVTEDAIKSLDKNDTVLIPAGRSFKIKRQDGARVLQIVMARRDSVLCTATGFCH